MCAPLPPYPATPAEFVEYQDWWSLMYPSVTETEETETVLFIGGEVEYSGMPAETGDELPF